MASFGTDRLGVDLLWVDDTVPPPGADDLLLPGSSLPGGGGHHTSHDLDFLGGLGGFEVDLHTRLHGGADGTAHGHGDTTSDMLSYLSASPTAASADFLGEGGPRGGNLAGWRCLEACHQPCLKCAPPPPVALSDTYQLVGLPGCKNGEKLLRHALVRTPEWNNERARGETAAEAEAVGDAVLAGLLRRRDSSQLRKAQILHLCHLWRYSSNVWRPRKSANTAAAAPASAAAATGQQRTASTPQSGSVRAVVPGPSRPPSPQPVTGVNVAPSLQQALQAAVVPHCQQAAYWLEGPQMRVQVAAVNAEVFDMQQRLADMQHGAMMLKRLQGVFHAKRLALRSWVTTVRAEQRRHPLMTPYDGQYSRDAAKQAWMALDGDEGVAEQLMRLLAAAWGAAGKDSRRNEAAIMTRAQAAGREEELAPHVRLWFDEMRNGFEQNLQLLSVAMALLAPFKCGELGGYILASDAVMEAIENSCQLSEAALTKRAEWIAAQSRVSRDENAAQPEPLPNTVKAFSRLIEVCAERPPAHAERASP